MAPVWYSEIRKVVIPECQLVGVRNITPLCDGFFF